MCSEKLTILVLPLLVCLATSIICLLQINTYNTFLIHGLQVEMKCNISHIHRPNGNTRKKEKALMVQSPSTVSFGYFSPPKQHKRSQGILLLYGKLTKADKPVKVVQK